MSGWIEWDGKGFGPGDLDPTEWVEVRFHDGSTDQNEAGAFMWDWEQPGDPAYYDVEAYRVVPA